jgi:hypothetical protein
MANIYLFNFSCLLNGDEIEAGKLGMVPSPHLIGHFMACDHLDTATGIVDERGQQTFFRSHAPGRPDALTFFFSFPFPCHRLVEEDQPESHHMTNRFS